MLQTAGQASEFQPSQILQTPVPVKTLGKTQFSRSDNTRVRSHRLSFRTQFDTA